MARPDGTTARLGLADWLGAEIQLSIFFYPMTLQRMRDAFEQDRKGIAVIELYAPINAPRIEIALDRRSLYVLGWRERGKTTWTRFTPKAGRPPELPGGRHKDIRNSGHYSEMRVPDRYRVSVMALLTSLARPPGDYSEADVRMMILLSAEALRFDSVMLEGMRWLATGACEVAAQNETVKNWEKASAARDPNVLLRHLP